MDSLGGRSDGFEGFDLDMGKWRRELRIVWRIGVILGVWRSLWLVTVFTVRGAIRQSGRSSQFYYMDREASKSKLMARTFTLDPNSQDSPADELPPTQAVPQPTVHQFILSEFKEKYDQLKSQFQSKKREADSLLYDKKKLEIELLNHNVEYYEKEITRLRAEVEKYQYENEENKHRFFVAENARKDLEATSKVRSQELKQTLKQLEKEKIAAVELKYQLTETTKNYTHVIADVEKRNHELAQKYDDATAALAKADSDLKATRADAERMKARCEEAEKRLREKEEEDAAFNEKVELNEYRSKHRIEDLEEELKDLSAKENDKIKKLEAQVRELEAKRKSEEFLLEQKVDAAAHAQQLRRAEGEIAALEERLRECLFALKDRDQKVLALEDKLKNVCSIELLNESDQKYAQALTSHKAVERALESRITQLEKEVEVGRLRGPSVVGVAGLGGKAEFQQLLKAQIEENGRLKAELSGKIDELFALRGSLEEQQVRESLLENEIDILKKRQRADEKNFRIGFDIDLQNLRNDLDSQRRRIEVTEAKLAIKTKEVKDKDAFISTVLIGRSRQEDVPFVVAELKRVFEAEYVSRLAEAQLKIQDLQARAGQ